MPPYYFFDSSAFVKHYHTEAGTAEVERLFAEPDAVHVIARLGGGEAQSAVARKVRERDLTAEGFELACERLQDDVRFQTVQVRPLTERPYQTSESLLRQHGPTAGLRSLDALQLGLAIANGQKPSNLPLRALLRTHQVGECWGKSKRRGNGHPGRILHAIVRAIILTMQV